MRISDWSSDVCSSDLPSSLLYGALMLHERHGMTLPGAIATVTGNPADMIGLDDRGRIRPGARADLIRVRRLGDGVPVVRSEERRVGKECVSTFRSRGAPLH